MESVIDQTLKEIEIICIDDGSTDHSLDIIKSYQAADERIRIVTENNAGVSIARNKGIIRVRGEYVIFLDADDFFEPTLLERLYETAKEYDLDVAVTKFDVYNNKTSLFSPQIEEPHGNIFTPGAVVSKSEYPDYILQSTTGYVWNKMFKASFIKEKELTFAPELYVFEDVHFVCTALSLAERVGRIDDVLIHHRIYSDQSRNKLFKKYYSQVPVVYLKVKDFMMHHGMYIPLSRSFLNFSVSRCFKIYNLLWNDAKADFWNMLHSGYADSLGWFQHESSDFESEELCDFAVNVGLYEHSQYQKRRDKGRKINSEKVTTPWLQKHIRSAKALEKVRAFFSKLFKRKKKNSDK
jgi:glycosyltransferase involved in cell wall biosynthesis